MKKDNEEPGVQAGFVAMFLLATEPQKQVQEEAFSKVEEILGKLIDEIFRYLNLRRFINQHWFSGFMLFKN